MTHILAKPLKVSVNETVWEEGGDPVQEHNSWYDLRSPEITITEEPAATYSVYIVSPVNGPEPSENSKPPVKVEEVKVKKSTPETGDSEGTLKWILAAAISLSGIIGSAAISRKKKNS